MRKRRRQSTVAAKKRLHARRIVRLCRAIARKDISDQFAELVESHIIAKLPAHLMRRLTSGDCGRPMREAMNLTIPFFA